MAYDVRSVTTATGTGTSVTLASPAGATGSDAVFVCVCHTANVQIAAHDLTQGWSLATTSAFGTAFTVRILQTAALANSGPWTFDFTSGGAPFTAKYAAAAICVQADTAVAGAQRPAIDTGTTTVTAATAGAFTFPTVTPTNTGDVLLYVSGWPRYTTLTPPGDTTEWVDVSTGTSSTDLQLWVGSQDNATTAGVATSPTTVANDNPGAFAAAQQAMITVGLMSVAPPTTWVGDFEPGDFSQYAFYLAADTSRITIRTDTPRQGSRYARFTALDSDVFPLTPTENPRAQLVSPRTLYPGTERWLTWSTRFPTDFPVIPPGGWLVFWQFHGPPYTGSPSVGFGVAGDHLNIERNQTYGFDTIWTGGMNKGEWQDFALHVNFAQDETGYIELWVNGLQQIFKGGVRRLYMRTVELDQNSGLEIDPTLYRLQGMFDVATLDYDAVRYDATVPTVLGTRVQTAAVTRLKVAG